MGSKRLEVSELQAVQHANKQRNSKPLARMDGDAKLADAKLGEAEEGGRWRVLFFSRLALTRQ